MKILLRTLGIVAVISFLGFLSYGIYKKKEEKSDVKKRIESLPAFSFNSLKGEDITRNDITGSLLWLIFFHSDCEYCQMQAENIGKTINANVLHIWMVSPEPVDSLSAFSKKYKLNGVSHVKLLNDKHDAGYHTFGVTSSPSSLLYSSDGTLIKSYKGVVKMETVLKDLKSASF
ncbi:Peroxiredoxin [Dyadobacter koreensis]|uniref:Peroxiredoxin n=1 Tax=Dyadobacter koreensis TaxID=408657 RepID=A0A1H6TYG5_9BACT|nr:redoxin domain-containing protein [Dyadobacter koreensis]SEI85158.1 Peroxiredoxin [Dyadobacter koreensis]